MISFNVSIGTLVFIIIIWSALIYTIHVISVIIKRALKYRKDESKLLDKALDLACKIASYHANPEGTREEHRSSWINELKKEVLFTSQAGSLKDEN
jgi:hypothetical protein